MTAKEGQTTGATQSSAAYRIDESLRYASTTAATLIEKLEAAAVSLEGVLDGQAPESQLLLRIDTLLVLLDQAIRLLSNLRSFIENALYDESEAPSESASQNGDGGDGDIDFDFDFESAATPAEPEMHEEEIEADLDASLEKITAVQQRDPRELLEELCVSCGMLFTELQSRRTRVAKRRQDGEPRWMLEDGDAALRKASSALRTVLQSTAALLGHQVAESHLVPDAKAEQHSALELRRYLMKLREVFTTATAGVADLPDDAISGTVEHVGTLLSECRAEPEFRTLRWPDRYAFMDFARRVREWSESQGTPKSAREILGDLSVYADLLSEVNRREQLVQHDREIRDSCLGELRDLSSLLALTTSGVWERFESVLESLRAMAGRSPPFDALVSSELEAGRDTEAKLQDRINRIIEALLSVPI